MSADIVERLEYACTQLEDDVLDFLYLQGGNDSKRYKTAQAINVLLREAAAEIGRLRGEVDRGRPKRVVSASELARLIRATFDHSGARVEHGYHPAIAPAEAKGPAPAMPNGGEDIDWPFTYIVPDSRHEYVPKHHAERKIREALRAADNRDAAGVEESAALYGMFRALVDAGGAKNVARYGGEKRAEALADALQRGMFAIEHRFHPERFEEFPVGALAPAAVPAGEAVARERSGVTAVFRICTAYEAGVGKGIQGRDVGNPYKPNTDEHEAWGYGFKQGRSVDEDEAELEFRPGDPDSPMPSQRAPAPVQAAPQEGEALARKFHDTYERLAPSFGYETRQETRQFDPETPNGRLMIAVCAELAAHHSACEMGAVQIDDAMIQRGCDAYSAKRMEETGEGESYPEGMQAALTAALQHRGYRRDGEATP